MVLRIAVGGVEKIVPTLPLRAGREWLAAIYADRPSGFSVPATVDTWTLGDVSEFTNLSDDVLLDVITSYDRTGALGDRAWLEDNADSMQLGHAAEQMIAAASYFAESPWLLLVALVARRVAGSSSPSSTNGPSPTGASTPKRSKRASTRPR